MLLSYLRAIPYTKFVLLEDNRRTRTGDLLDSILRSHEDQGALSIHYFIFGGNYRKAQQNHHKYICYDFASDVRNWFTEGDNLSKAISNVSSNCVVVIDSLAHVLYKYGLAETCQLINNIKEQTNVQQFIAVLHLDLLENPERVRSCFHHLATLHLELDAKYVSYVYKKSQRTIIKQIEQYEFKDGHVQTTSVAKPAKMDINEAAHQILPENLSTFKITLSHKDKESRSNLVLPYLPKEEASDPVIHYTFDEVDDWDEEDPDDDLNI